jgi:hypothetical protein
MAFVLDVTKTAGTEGVSATTLTFDDWFSAADGLQAGDYIMVVCSNQTGTATALELNSGTGSWTKLDSIDSPRVGTVMRSQIWWHKYDGTTLPTTPTASNGATTRWVGISWVVRDAPDVADQSWIDVNARADNSTLARVFAIPSVTTTEADCLLLTVYTRTGASAFEKPDRFWGVDFLVARKGDDDATFGNIQSVTVASRAQYTAGATPAYDYVNGNTGGVRTQIWNIAIKNKVGGAKPIGVTNPPTRVTDFFEDTTFPTGLVSLSTIHATIEGVSTFAPSTNSMNTQSGLGSNPPVPFWTRRFLMVPPAATTGVSGLRWNLPTAVDYTAGLWVMSTRSGNTATDSILGPLHYFEDSTGNWGVYRFISRPRSIGFLTIICYLPDETPVDGSVTPVDFTDITKRGIAYRQTGANTAQRFFDVASECIQPFTAPLTLLGGGLANPITARTVAKMLSSGGAWNLAFAQGLGQQVITMPYQLGDGTVATYVDDEAQSLEYPSVGGVLGYTVLAGRQEIRVKASASDTILFDAGIKGTSRIHNFVFDSATSTSATYGMAGTFLGWVPTLQAGLTLRSGTYIGCAKIDAKGANVSDSIIKSSIATDAAMRLEDTGRANRSEFIKGAETYAIEIFGTGTVTLEEVTYTGYTKPLNILATTGTVTIELAAGDTQPTFDSAGATVVFLQPIPTQSVTVSNGVAGTLLLIQDVTDPANPITLYLNSPASFPHTWTDPSPYVADRDIRVRAAFQSGATAKIFLDELIGTSTSTALALAYRLNQVDDTVYILNAIDGSTVTDVVIDDAALLIEVDTGTISWDLLYAFEVYWLATAAGIVDEGRIITAIDAANYVFEGPWKIKNVSSPSVPLVISGGYGRSKVDGTTATLIDTTGGTVFSNPDQVIAFATGSGVTPQDKTDIIDGVINAASSTPIHADIRKVNSYTVLGEGTVSNPWGPA